MAAFCLAISNAFIVSNWETHGSHCLSLFLFDLGDLLNSGFYFFLIGSACKHSYLHLVARNWFLFAQLQTFKVRTSIFSAFAGQSTISWIKSVGITLLPNNILGKPCVFILHRLVNSSKTIATVFFHRAKNPWWCHHLPLRATVRMVTSFTEHHKRIIFGVLIRTRPGTKKPCGLQRFLWVGQGKVYHLPVLV